MIYALAVTVNPVLQLVLSTLGAAIVSGLVGWGIAVQNRRASKDVAREEANATVTSTREQAEAEAYTRARGSLEGTIAALERENARVRQDADAAAARCTQRINEQDATIHEQAEDLREVRKEVRHLRNQDQAKQRIIDRMGEELRTTQAALRLAVHDEDKPGEPQG